MGGATTLNCVMPTLPQETGQAACENSKDVIAKAIEATNFSSFAASGDLRSARSAAFESLVAMQGLQESAQMRKELNLQANLKFAAVRQQLQTQAKLKGCAVAPSVEGWKMTTCFECWQGFARPVGFSNSSSLRPVEPIDVLRFWFGGEPYSWRAGLWFSSIHPEDGSKGADATSKRARQSFGDVLRSCQAGIAKSPVASWKETSDGRVALSVLLGQLPKIVFRGQKEMILYRDVAQEVSQMALDKDANSMPWPHRLWCLMSFADSENEEIVDQAALEILQLSLQAESSKQDRIRVVHRQMKERVAVLRRFGRYPHYNDYLGRNSTSNELQWLRQKSVPGWALKATRDSDKSLVETKALPAEIPTKLPELKSKLRVLVLHGNRQTAEGFRNKTEAIFKPLVPLIDFVFLDGTFAHGAVLADDRVASGQSRGRCWWDATDDPNDIRYVGLEATIEYIDEIFATKGPFDGVLGFSQGACLAGLLASIQPKGHIDFKFCILISGFYCRDVNYLKHQLEERPEEHTLEHVKIIKEKVNMPSFHIWGDSDEMVLPWRSQLLADLFTSVHSKRVSHPSDHFNRARHQWPIHELQQWLLGEVSPFLQPSVEVKLKGPTVELEQQIRLISELLDRHPSLVDYGNEKTSGPKEKDREFADEIGNVADALSHVSDIEQQINWIQRLATVHPKGWSVLNMMDLYLSKAVATSSSRHIRAAIAETFARQLKQDYDAASVMKEMHGRPLPSSTSSPSLCVRQAPRYGSDFERRTRLSSRIARRLAAYEKPELADVDDEDLQRLRLLQPELSRKYRHITSTITTALNIQSGHNTKKDGIQLSNNDEFEAMLAATDFEKLRSMPISDAVLNPIPEPVEYATSDQLEPLFIFLESGQDLSVAKPLFDGPTSAGDIVFPKGTVTPDGRLDLCKQVIGPAGVDNLIHALDVDGAVAENPVQHLLLGNNKCEDGLPARIAQFLASGKSKLTTWYIAGNHISGHGIQPLCEVLKTDQQVRQLWLKRNPLRAVGALHIANMLNQNLKLEVLDLLNCGLLDLGAKALARGVETSFSLRHLYLDGNGFTYEGAAVIAKAATTRLRSGLKPLWTLSLGMNRLLDVGVDALVHELITDLPSSSPLPAARLCLASCGLSSAASSSLARLLGGPMHSLRYLDLGCSKATRALGEVPNRIGDEGAKTLATALMKQGEASQREDAVLLSGLVLTYNGIARVGLEALATALKQHRGLVVLNIEQTKADLRCEVAREQVRLKLAKNAQHLKFKSSEEQQLVQETLDPAHLEEIKSVYRVGNTYSPGGGIDIQ